MDYLKLEQGDDMLAAFERAKALEYPAAWFALAVVYHTGNGIVETDLDRAPNHFIWKRIEKGLDMRLLVSHVCMTKLDPPFLMQKRLRYGSRSLTRLLTE